MQICVAFAKALNCCFCKYTSKDRSMGSANGGEGVGELSSPNQAGGGKSASNWAVSGMFAYRTTRYPAVVNQESRSSSSTSRPLWLLSSSSMTAKTWKDLVQSKKSANFLLNWLRVSHRALVISAEKLTCDKTTCCGNVELSRKYIPCSRCDSTGFLRTLCGARLLLPFFHAVTAAIANIKASSAQNIQGKFFTAIPPASGVAL